MSVRAAVVMQKSGGQKSTAKKEEEGVEVKEENLEVVRLKSSAAPERLYLRVFCRVVCNLHGRHTCRHFLNDL